MQYGVSKNAEFDAHFESVPAKNVFFAFNFCDLWYPNGIFEKKKSFFLLILAHFANLKPNAEKTAPKNQNVFHKCVCNTKA